MYRFGRKSNILESTHVTEKALQKFLPAFYKMTITVYLSNSNGKGKRYEAVIQPENFTVYFGDPRYQNVTIRKDKGRKRLNIIRLEKNVT